MRNIKNDLSKKAATHTATYLGDGLFRVISGASGDKYLVRMLSYSLDISKGARCSCPWGTKPYHVIGSGCSHVQAAMDEAGKLTRHGVKAHVSVESARKTHRKMVDIGDGVIVTMRNYAGGKVYEDPVFE